MPFTCRAQNESNCIYTVYTPINNVNLDCPKFSYILLKERIKRKYNAAYVWEYFFYKGENNFCGQIHQHCVSNERNCPHQLVLQLPVSLSLLKSWKKYPNLLEPNLEICVKIGSIGFSIKDEQLVS